MFSTFTVFIKVSCMVPYRYSICSLNVSKFQKIFGKFSDSIKVTCKVAYR